MFNKQLLFLVYHRLVDENFDLSTVPADQRPYCLRRSDFQKQIEYLYNDELQTVSLREFVRFRKDKAQLPKKSIILTAGKA